MSNGDKFTTVFVMVLVALIVGFLVGAFAEHARNESAAIREGRAEYYLDSNNNRQFRYKTK